jgi:tetratricopeptide (TPR) repeat protein
MKRAGGFVLLLLLSACTSTQIRTDLAMEYYNLGNAYYRLGDYERAIELYHRSIDYDSEILNTPYNLSLALIRRGSAEEAKELLQQLLEREPDNVSLLRILGYANYSQGSHEEALLIFERILNLVPGDPGTVYNRGIVLWEMEHLEEARRSFQELLLREGDNRGELYRDTLFNLGELLLQMNNAGEAAIYFERYLEWESDDADALSHLAEAYRELERYLDAVEVYQVLLSLDGEQEEVWMSLAEIYLTRVEDERRGIEALARALDLGFSEQSRFDGLLAEPTLVAPDEIRQMIEHRGAASGG